MKQSSAAPHSALREAICFGERNEKLAKRCAVLMTITDVPRPSGAEPGSKLQDMLGISEPQERVTAVLNPLIGLTVAAMDAVRPWRTVIDAVDRLKEKSGELSGACSSNAGETLGPSCEFPE